MSWSPKSSLLRQKIDEDYEKKMRASSLRWLAVNGALFAVFAYDLCCLCSSHKSLLHYVEACAAAVLAANALLHALRLGTCSAPAAAAAAAASASATPATPSPCSPACASPWPPDALARPWRREPPSPPSPHPPHSPNSPQSPNHRDEFIADQRTLAQYLSQRQQSAAEASEPPAAGWRAEGEALRPPPPPPPLSYHLAPLDTVSTESVAEGAGGPAGEEGGPGGRSPQALRRLHLEPQLVTQYLLNLRLWIHVTILERVVREAERLDALLAAAGAEARVGAATLDRLAAAAAAAPGAAPRLAALAPFLELFPDQRYFVQRLRELARGGCLSGYRWDGGGADWDESRPADAELVLQLFATYMDTQLPGAGRPFTATHVSAAPATPPRGPRALAVHRVTARPPHYVLALPEEVLEVARGRDNLLLTLLVFAAAAAARSDPPALQRVHLGRAGLNLLWVIGRR